jgi:hypothetical protein
VIDGGLYNLRDHLGERFSSAPEATVSRPRPRREAHIRISILEK